ncbi:MAG: Mth938-like domain-containing protein [Aquabacterium sp.]|uniref:Mth938-like domain-containing protein n=1 Tax=Aquabacterium sp. TaxID=1872578 RepID=UPI0025C2997B|nr:Mth938-like domain-containing protein [Aquabacterium sp.]MBI3380711.1 Mth938-like domain-containing protein [Aquabacterium sp.]
MKLQADRAEGVNIINAYTAASVSVNGEPYTTSILVPPTGPVIPWDVSALSDLTEAHFERMAEARPELIIFGSGRQLRFPPPALLRPLMAARIGIETMDTAAAARTYNILVAEGRQVMAALLIHS